MFSSIPSWGAGQAEEGRVLEDVMQKRSLSLWNHKDAEKNTARQAHHVYGGQWLLKIPGSENCR